MTARTPRLLANAFLVAAMISLPVPVIMRWLGYLEDYNGVEVPVSFGLMFLFLAISAGLFFLASRMRRE